MPNALVTVTLPYKTGIPRDVAVTTWAFQHDGFPGRLFDIANAVIEWWNTPVSPSTEKVASYISPAVDRPNCVLEIYDITSLPSGPPVWRETFALASAATSAGPLPLEVALVNTVVGDGPVSVPIRRRRGRQYIGPFSADAIGAKDDNDLPRPASGLVNTMVAASFRLSAYGDGSTPPFRWCVWSRKSDTLTEVKSGWVNNEWDTQRRRGADETARTTWSIMV